MINKVILIGRVGQDPEVRNTDSGKVANFSLATSENYKDKSGIKVEQTEWHNIVAWNKTAEFVENYVKKGSLLYVEGTLKTQKWVDKDGQNREKKIINAMTLRNLSGKDEAQKASEPEIQDAGGYENDDLPF